MEELEKAYRQLDQLFKSMHGLPYPNDLTRVYWLMERLGSPHKTLPAVIVTGSKGKGSTATFLAALMLGDGKKVGLFTGPHLHSFRERFKINGEDIDAVTFVALYQEVWATVQKYPELEGVSRFEIVTAMAFLYFSRAAVDLAVLEVGLGGRFDAVNVALNHQLAVFTPLELEHLHALGPTLENIVYHKSGVMRAQGIAVTSRQSPQAQDLLEEAAVKMQAELRYREDYWRYRPGTLKLELNGTKLGQHFEADGPDGQVYQLQTGLAGTFQVENALTALSAAYILEDQKIPNLAALADAIIPGRLEAVATDPLVIIDGAHTPNAMRELAATLQNMEGTPVWVLGFLRDKQIDKMLAELPLEGRAVFLYELHSYRGAAVEQIKESLTQTPAQLEVFQNDLKGAIEAARQTARTLPGGYVCVTGSLYMVSEARVALNLLDPDTAQEARILAELDQELKGFV